MISCVIPTMNEASNLHHVARTLRWCDDVIVVDMASTDGTADVARALGMRFIPVQKHMHFNFSREIGLKAARNDWVLALDADEMVPPKLAETIIGIAAAAKYEVAVIPRVNFKFGLQQSGGLWPDYQWRFYKKEAVDFVAATHNYLEVRTDRVMRLVPDMKSALHHFNYIPVDKQIDKLNLYTSADVLTAGPDSRTPAPLRVFKTFASLHFKHGGRTEGIPGLWWSTYMSFYQLVERRKRFEIGQSGNAASAEHEIGQLNCETALRAKDRVENGKGQPRVSIARLACRMLGAAFAGGSLDSRVWNVSVKAFADLALEVKVWELACGRAMAEQAQDDMRSALAQEWEGYRGNLRLTTFGNNEYQEKYDS